MTMKKMANAQGREAQGKQPAGDELPGRKREEEEVQRLGKDGIDDVAGCVGGVPEEGEGGPLRHHAGSSDQRDHERSTEG